MAHKNHQKEAQQLLITGTFFSLGAIRHQMQAQITSSICNETSPALGSLLISSDCLNLKLQLKILKLRIHILQFVVCISTVDSLQSHLDFAPYLSHITCCCCLLCVKLRVLPNGHVVFRNSFLSFLLSADGSAENQMSVESDDFN